MHIPRKAGQQIEVDWAGDSAKLIDPDTGEITEAWIFVGVMTYSQYAFVEAFINEQQKSWITAHVHMYEFFGGVTPILVSDNAPTATNRKQSDKSFGNIRCSNSASVSDSSSGQLRDNSSARFWTFTTVFLETLRLFSMSRRDRPKAVSLRISRYLVI